MPHHAHLPEAGSVLAHQGHQRSAPARSPPLASRRSHLGALLFCLLLLASLFQPAHAQTCGLQFAEMHAAKELPGTQGRPTEGWEPVTLPDTWTQRWPDYSGAVWYRLALREDCAIAQDANAPLGLVVKSINLAGEIYVNDSLLWRDASLQEPLSRSWNTPRFWILPEAALHADGNAIWIRVHSRALVHPGLGHVILGPAAQMLALQQQSWWMQRTIFVINIVASLCIAGMFTGIWLLYRKQAVHGLFALLNLAWVVFVYNVVATDPWPFSDTASMVRANLIAFMVFVTTYTLFIFRLLQEGPLQRWQQRCLPALALALALSLPALFVAEQYLGLYQRGASIIYLGMYGMACIAPMVFAWRSRKIEHVLYAVLGVGFAYIAATDFHTFQQKDPDPFMLTPYANLITMITITGILGSRIAASMRRTEQFNVELTAAVDQACRELETTMDKEHQLALSNSRLQERLQFIHDLHDGFGSALVRAIVHAERHAGAHADANRHVSTLKSLRDDLRNVMDGGRTAQTNMPATPAEWMAPTRHRFSTLFDELDIESHWSCPAAWPSPPTVALCMELTRLLEEALSNVLKHSAATEVTIALAADARGALTLEVHDNGTGFDIAAIQQGTSGIGLSSMQARVARLGGTLQLESRPGYSVVRAHLGAVAA